MFKRNITKENVLKEANKGNYNYVLREIANEKHELGYQLAIVNTSLIITFKEKENIQLVEAYNNAYAIHYTGPSVKRCFKELEKRLEAWF